MEYTLITIIAIVSATILVHQLANRLLDVQISIKPLALCALCSLFLSLVLPRFIVSFTGLAGTIGVLAVFAIIFAYFIVYYEDMQSKEKTDQNILHEVPATGLVPSIYQSPSIMDNSSEFKVQENAGDSKITDPDKTSDNSHNIDDASSIQPSVEVQNQNHDNMSYVNKEQSMISEQNRESSNENYVQQTNDLDELLNYAFSQKNAHNFPQAINSFRQIMHLYPDSSSALFAAIEIGNMLKNIAEYEQAIQVFTDAMILPAIQENAGLQLEFGNTVEYLRTTKQVLFEHQLGHLPFNLIPHEVLQQINNMHNGMATDQSNDATTDILTCDEEPCKCSTDIEHKAESIIPEHDEESSNVSFTDLDELLDYAFSQKTAKGFPQAMVAFRQIISLYPNSSSASFAAIEIGNMLKNTGDYDQAIQVFTDAIALPAHQGDASLQKEFGNAAEYMRIIKKVLLERQLGNIPFNEIPHEVLQQIDNEHRSFLTQC